MGGGKLSRSLEAALDRIAAIESWLLKGLSPRGAHVRAQEPPPRGLGLSRWTSSRYVGHAVNRLRSDHAAEPIESKRARIVAMTQAQVEGALNQKRTYETNGKKVEYESPDRKSAIAATRLLADLELGALKG